MSPLDVEAAPSSTFERFEADFPVLAALLLLLSAMARFELEPAVPAAPAVLVEDVDDMLLQLSESSGVGAWEVFGAKKLVKELC